MVNMSLTLEQSREIIQAIRPLAKALGIRKFIKLDKPERVGNFWGLAGEYRPRGYWFPKSIKEKQPKKLAPPTIAYCPPVTYKWTFAHEIGHRLYDLVSNSRRRDEIQPLLSNEERIAIKYGYFNSHGFEERFASQFASYVTNPSKLQVDDPEAYNTIERILSGMPHIRQPLTEARSRLVTLSY